MASRITFRVNPEKALEAIVWLANEKPAIGFYLLVKMLFFADKAHLERYGRPIIGDRYIAMEHGPVPSLVYDMLKRDDFLEPDLVGAVEQALEFPPERPRTVRARRPPRVEVLSRTDVECLRGALQTYGSMSFAQLREAAHAVRAYAEAPANGEMDYALMVDAGVSDRERFLEELRETAPYLQL